MSHLDILLPFALPPAELSADLCKALHAPALSSLLARAKRCRDLPGTEPSDGFHRALPHERWLAQAFGAKDAIERNSSPPIARGWMRAFDLDPGDGAWFALQPVHIHVARDHLVLTDPRQLLLRTEDARTLYEMAAPLCEEAGKALLWGDANTWFVRADDWAGLQTSSPDAASGRNIDIWMPRGAGERDWRKLQNEVQMHWFDHAINQEREARGEKPVNSVWLWGGATADETAAGAYTDAINLDGWSAAFGAPASGRERAETATEAISRGPQRALVMLDALLEPALAGDWSRWLDRMHALEEQWFAPLLQALKTGAIDGLSLIATNDAALSRFALSRASLRKFWLKPSLTPLCA